MTMVSISFLFLALDIKLQVGRCLTYIGREGCRSLPMICSAVYRF